jgi:hypothetical protein
MIRLALFAIMLILGGCSTALPTSTPPPGSFDISASVSALEVQVGESLIVTTDSGSAELATYTVSINDVQLSRLSYVGRVVDESAVDTPMRVIERSSVPESAEWTLEATEPGTYEVLVTVQGRLWLGGPSSRPAWYIADKLFFVTVR